MKKRQPSIPATCFVAKPTPKAHGAHPPLHRSSPVNGNATSSPHATGQTIQTPTPVIGKSAHPTTTSTCHDPLVQPSGVEQQPRAGPEITRRTRNNGGAIATVTPDPSGVKPT